MSNNLYLSKLLSWLKFNERVLDLSKSDDTPLLERIKFLAITASNLDEFFMVRMARLIEKLDSNYNSIDEGDLTTEELYKKLSSNIHDLYHEKYYYYEHIQKELTKNKLHILNFSDCKMKEKKYLEQYFNENIFPVLTPMAVDQSRPFPLLLNKSLTLGVKLEHTEDNLLINDAYLESNGALYAFVRVPSILPRLVHLKTNDTHKYIYIESIIKAFISKLFNGYNILSITQFRITKNADVELDNNASDFLKEMENYVNRRKWGFPVRLEIIGNYDEDFFNFLMSQYDLPKESIYKINGPINLGNLFDLYNIKGFNDLKYKYHSPRKSSLEYEEDLFKAIQAKDYLLHRPYERFDVVNQLIEKAVNDDQVLAIKQTLYRVSGDSKLVENLARAAKKGKQVTVLVELKARFDEKQNIEWAKRLEKSGCHIVYGFSGFKVHSKILLIIREEDDGIKKYLHFSTGNYNDQTAKLYTDIDLITANPELGQDASNLFNLLTGYHLNPNFNYLKIAPINLKDSIIQLINNEILNVKKGKKGYIIAKMNSLVDESIIDKLYEASQAGVKIDLIVRGMSCIRPGIENLSENITVKSIIGKFLEHSRLSYFYNGGNEKVFISSADWRPRNLYRRVEQMVPIYDDSLKKHIKNILIKNLEDTENSWIQESNGNYTKDKPTAKTLDTQEVFFAQIKDQMHYEKDNFLKQIKNKFLK